ncbi:MAG: hypothetical protein RIF32_07045 [Leptospirales bacterium]
MPEPDSSRVYLDDASLLLLASGDERKQALLARLLDHVKQDGQVFTSAAALATVQEFFLARNGAPRLRQYWNGLDGLFREILPLRGEDLGRALDLVEYMRLPENPPDSGSGTKPSRSPLDSARALHAAIALNHGIDSMVDPLNCYGDIPGIKAFEF